MIPGKNTCYAGWTFEYEGLLAAGHYGIITFIIIQTCPFIIVIFLRHKIECKNVCFVYAT
jgi:hypothetical protein